MTNQQPPEFLDAALKRVTQAQQPDQIAVNRVLARLSPPLPRQKISLWRWPAVLLDWQFAPAWPRVAALACCALIGFGIGLSGLDRSLRQSDAPMVVAGRDLGSIVFEPEPLTGARP